LEFLPALTFALILFTNFLVLIASIRAKALAVGAEERSPVAALPQR